MREGKTTERGRKHLGELARLARKGIRAVQFFCISRSDVRAIQPADRIDREYGKALRRAIRAGVEPTADAPPTIQERAWSSPIAYRPR